jgi:alkylated DNA repair dioxygenase AlkB
VKQLDLFAPPVELPEGFVYRAEFISPEEERALLAAIGEIAFGEVRMHGVIAKRRVVHFGCSYEYARATVGPGAPIPGFLLPLRERVGAWTGRGAAEFAEVLVTEYPVGAPIGWHRDAPPFDIVAGVSLLGECTMHLRPWSATAGAGSRKRLAQVLEPRSAYLIAGASRSEWEHHIPPARTRRISITFRTLRQPMRGTERRGDSA